VRLFRLTRRESGVSVKSEREEERKRKFTE